MTLDSTNLGHRMAEATITLRDARGKARADVGVTIRQVRHRFLFGCNIFGLDSCGSEALNQEYGRRFAELLNFATLPFYWGGYEPQPGETKEERLRRLALWCREHGITTKGHPLCWHEVCPSWLPQKPLEAVMDVQLARIRREVAAFAGLVDTWDVVNEACVMPNYPQRENPIARLCRRQGRVKLIQRTFAAARETNPAATLLLNDYETSPKYAELIDRCLDAGVPIQTIGIQSHMHAGYWGAEKLWEVCERFARFGLPLHFTELTLLSGALKTDNDWHADHPGWDSTPDGEERQAREVEETYRTLFAHPAVHAVTWWDFADLRAWQGAPAGLLRKDLTPKPAYERLMALIRDAWWTKPITARTDAHGSMRFQGFLGDYQVEVNDQTVPFVLDAGGKVEKSVQI